MKPDVETLKELDKGDVISINGDKYEVEEFDRDLDKESEEIILSKQGEPQIMAAVKYIIKYNSKGEVKFEKIISKAGGRFAAYHAKKAYGSLTYPEYEEVIIKEFSVM